MSHAAILQAQLKEYELRLRDGELEQLLSYIFELERWNRTINLTALKGPSLIRHLVIEPLWALERLSPRGYYLDIGSGNGSPAIPWHIRGDFAATQLVEARTRRAAFLRQAARKLGLERVTVHRGRFEDVASEITPANWVTLQGVRLTARLLEKMRPKKTEATNVVWFTKTAEPPELPTHDLEIPFSDRRALVFEL